MNDWPEDCELCGEPIPLCECTGKCRLCGKALEECDCHVRCDHLGGDCVVWLKPALREVDA
jgi:hypothetical protein